MGRETRKKKTTRPDSLWPEMWRGLSEKEKQKAIDDWENEKGPLQDARQKRGVYEVLPEDEEHFLHILSEAKKNHSIPEAPSMPTISMSLIAMRMKDSKQEFVQAISYLEQCITPATATKSSASNATPSTNMENEPGLPPGEAILAQEGFAALRKHQDHIADAGTMSESFYGMVHKPIQAYKKIKKAKDAVDEEWEKLEGKRERKNGKKSIAWDVKAVKPRAEVEKRARDKGIVVHFGELMALCHLKNAELAEFLQRYKGRIVFRGDGVKDADGFYAVFTEQGASASHMSATKFVDTVAHFPGNTGEDSDAIGAYTQILLADAARLLGIGVLPETWIKLPKDRQPKEWEGIVDPVCPLLQNLYGHPLAGLLWEKGCHEKLVAEVLSVSKDGKAFMYIEK